MLMSELIERHEAVPDRHLRSLTRALIKTGPVVHELRCWSGRLKYGRYELTTSRKIPKRFRLANMVEVPWGTLPELDRGDEGGSLDAILVDRFKGYIQAIESGIATTQNPKDLETLIDNLENLADDIRAWNQSNILREQLAAVRKRLGRTGEAASDS